MSPNSRLWARGLLEDRPDVLTAMAWRLTATILLTLVSLRHGAHAYALSTQTAVLACTMRTLNLGSAGLPRSMA